MKKFLFITALIALICPSCNRRITKTLEKDYRQIDSCYVQKDSTWYRDSTITIAGDSSKIEAIVKPDSAGNINLPLIVTQTNRSKTSISIINGRLKADCVCKELELRVQIQERLIQAYKRVYVFRQKDTVKETNRERPIPVWVKFFAWCGAILLFLVFLIIILKFKKLIF
jgi:hypothetical protein